MIKNTKHTIIIAEAGVNHNGELSIAKELIDVAVKSGADYVKFQTFKTSDLVTKTAVQADYQIRNQKSETSVSQYEMLSRLELTKEEFRILASYARSNKIGFISTAFDLGSLSFVNTFKAS